VLALVLLALAVGLLSFAYAGSFSRLWADDYCYSAHLQQNGLLRGMWEWYVSTSSRFSVIPLVALTDALSFNAFLGVRLLPGVVLLAWVLSGWFLLRQVQSRFWPGWPVQSGWLLAAALLLTFFAVWLSPQRLQTVYWRMGILHYSLPMPLAMSLFAVGLRRLFGRQTVVLLFGMGLFALFIACLSETFAAMQLGALMMLFGLVLLKLKTVWRGGALRLIAAVGAGTLLGMILMALSPANAMRQAMMPPPESVWQLIDYTLRYTGAFLYHSLKDQPLPNLVFAAFIGLFAWWSAPAGRMTLRQSGLWLVLLSGFTFGLIFCGTAPSVYGGLSAPAGRALMPMRFAWLLGVGAIAFVFGRLLAGWLSRERLRVATLLFFVILSVYPLRTVAITQQETTLLAVKAARWDERHAQLMADLAAGQRDLVTIETDVVQSLEDYGPDPNNWVNVCAARYYQADSLTAK
jgi:hypothetical protein